MSTTITEYELQIPGRFVALFRLSLIDEVKADTDYVKANSAALEEFYVAPDDYDADVDDLRATLENRLADLSSMSRFLSDDHSLLERIARHEPSPGHDLTVRGPFETLHGALQATIRRAAKDLVEAASYAPIEGARILHRAAAATWAAEQSDRLSSETATDPDDEHGGDA
jgi:hypothetical protein